MIKNPRAGPQLWSFTNHCFSSALQNTSVEMLVDSLSHCWKIFMVYDKLVCEDAINIVFTLERYVLAFSVARSSALSTKAFLSVSES
jgi:hypothetical protein